MRTARPILLAGTLSFATLFGFSPPALANHLDYIGGGPVAIHSFEIRDELTRGGEITIVVVDTVWQAIEGPGASLCQDLNRDGNCAPGDRLIPFCRTMTLWQGNVDPWTDILIFIDGGSLAGNPFVCGLIYEPGTHGIVQHYC